MTLFISHLVRKYQVSNIEKASFVKQMTEKYDLTTEEIASFLSMV